MSYVYVSKHDIHKWQLATLEIQQKVQNLFDAKDITNWLGGGTLIGAIRGKKFLYWDNDIDMFFMFRDYKKIFYLFWEKKLYRQFDIYIHRMGYWVKHEELMNILSKDILDEQLLDYLLRDVTKAMFKLFSKTSIPIKFITHDVGDDPDYVKVNYKSKHHMTKYRLVRQNDMICDETTYNVLPNLCMLPMVKLTNMEYVNSSFMFVLLRLLELGISFIESKELFINKHNNYHFNVTPPEPNSTNTEFLPVYYDSKKEKVKLVISNFTKSSFSILRGLFNNRSGNNFIAYKQIFFRFLVQPFRYEDILPTRKIIFENYKINIPKNTGKVLKNQFGDYMKVPDKERRIALPFFIEDRMDI